MFQSNSGNLKYLINLKNGHNVPNLGTKYWRAVGLQGYLLPSSTLIWHIDLDFSGLC